MGGCNYHSIRKILGLFTGMSDGIAGHCQISAVWPEAYRYVPQAREATATIPN
jgi:hypothetical protein